MNAYVFSTHVYISYTHVCIFKVIKMPKFKQKLNITDVYNKTTLKHYELKLTAAKQYFTDGFVVLLNSLNIRLI